MADQIAWIKGTDIALETNGSLIADGGFDYCSTALTAANLANYEYFKLWGEFTPAVAPADALPVRIYAQEDDIDGSGGNSPNVDGDYRHHPLGEIPIDIVATATKQSMQPLLIPVAMIDVGLWVWVENTTGQSISAGWKLYATPVTRELKTV